MNVASKRAEHVEDIAIGRVEPQLVESIQDEQKRHRREVLSWKIQDTVMQLRDTGSATVAFATSIALGAILTLSPLKLRSCQAETSPTTTPATAPVEPRESEVATGGPSVDIPKDTKTPEPTSTAEPTNTPEPTKTPVPVQVEYKLDGIPGSGGEGLNEKQTSDADAQWSILREYSARMVDAEYVVWEGMEVDVVPTGDDTVAMYLKRSDGSVLLPGDANKSLTEMTMVGPVVSAMPYDWDISNTTVLSPEPGQIVTWSSEKYTFVRVDLEAGEVKAEWNNLTGEWDEVVRQEEVPQTFEVLNETYAKGDFASTAEWFNGSTAFDGSLGMRDGTVLKEPQGLYASHKWNAVVLGTRDLQMNVGDEPHIVRTLILGSKDNKGQKFVSEAPLVIVDREEDMDAAFVLDIDVATSTDFSNMHGQLPTPSVTDWRHASEIDISKMLGGSVWLEMSDWINSNGCDGKKCLRFPTVERLGRTTNGVTAMPFAETGLISTNQLERSVPIPLITYVVK